jgi:hypothetical protein
LSGTVQKLVHLDRRWIFLVMAIAVMIPVLFRTEFPEKPTTLVQVVFDRVESLAPGSTVLMPMDYDPGSAPELQPMATALTWHCAKKGLKIYFMALWPLGPQMTTDTIDSVIKADFPDYKYGVDYINLGFKPGQEGVIKVVASNLKELYTTDHTNRSLADFEMTRDLKNIRDIDLILNISAGYPGTKEWVQYAATPLNIPIAGGCTGVQAPLLYPYIPNQLFGLLGAIKGAAEYEAALKLKYPDEYGVLADGKLNKNYLKGHQRMGPQLIAHCLIMGLIVLGNVIMAMSRKPGVA